MRQLAITCTVLAAFTLSVGATADGTAGDDQDTPRQLTLDDIFPTDRVLDVRITLAKKDWDTIRRQSRNIFTALQEKRRVEPIEHPYTYVNASMTIDGVKFPEVGLRKKGFIGSLSSVRPSLKIKLNHSDKEGGIEGLTNLTFNNNKQDGSLLCQFMGYALFNAAGSPAPRCAFAKVTVNGKNLGVYSHVETMRKPLMKRSFGNSKGTLYEGTVVDFHEGWEGSFERKFGKDKRARKKIRKLIKVLQGKDGDTILGSDADGRGWVPTDGELGDTWTAVDFDDSGWKRGRNGAGYDQAPTYRSLLSEPFDFKAEMYKKSASLFLRFPFEIDDLEKVVSNDDLVLRMKYDDGFVAYLNGHRVAASNAPENPQWNSKATRGHDDSAAMRFEPHNISAHKDKLRKGRNVLAIHGLNIAPSSSDMLIVAEIQTNDFDYEKAIGKLVDLDSFYTFWAVEGLIGFWDGYSGNNNNFFVYLNPETDKFHFLPWGADAVFQKFSMLPTNRRAPLSVKTKGLIAHTLYQLKSGRDRYARTLMNVLDKHWDEEALVAEVDRIEAMLRPHLSRSLSRHRRSLSRIRRFIRSRRDDIVAEISDGMPIWTSKPAPPPIIPADPNRGRGADTIWNAAKSGKIATLKEHLAKGADVNRQDEMGVTPLSWAAMAGRAEAVELLINQGAKVNGKNRDGTTPLHGSAFLGRTEIVKLLIKNKADVNFRNTAGETPLAVVSPKWNEEIQGITEFVGGVLGIKVDVEKIEAARPRIADILRKHGGVTGEEF